MVARRKRTTVDGELCVHCLRLEAEVATNLAVASVLHRLEVIGQARAVNLNLFLGLLALEALLENSLHDEFHAALHRFDL